MDKNYRTVIETGSSDPQWDNFLCSTENGHHEQSTYWAKVKAHQGWRAFRIKVYKGHELLAGAQMLCKQLPVGGSVGYISSGPCYVHTDHRALGFLVRSINELARKQKIQYTAVTPYVRDERLSNVFRQNGFSIKPETLPPSSSTTATLLIDLSKSLETLLMETRRETRREIKVATVKSGFTMREGSKEDVVTAFNLMAAAVKRRGENPIPANVEVFEKIWDYFNPNGLVKSFLIEFRDSPVSAGLIFPFGNAVRFWKYGWSGHLSKNYPNQLLYWELIKWSKDNGFRYFDIVQVDPIVTDQIYSGMPLTNELKSRRLFGPTFFKTGFGGDVIKFSGPWFRFQNPLIRSFYRHFGPSLLQKPFAMKIILRLAQ